MPGYGYAPAQGFDDPAVEIGTPVAGGTANAVLYTDAASKVAQSSIFRFAEATGHMSIGTTPDAAGPYAATIFSRQYIYESKTTIGTAAIEAPFFVWSNINLAAHEAGNACFGGAIYHITQSGNTKNLGYMYGFASYAHHNGSGTVTDLEAISGAVVNYETGTLTYAAGGYFSVGNVVAGGTLTKASAINASVYIDHGTVTQVRGLALEFWYKTAGTVTTSYGIYADTSIDIGTTRYFIYSLSTSPSLLSGVLTAAGIVMTDATDIVLSGTTGTKIGTATTQKLGFWNATPRVQPSAYTPSNVVTDRSFDANATSIDELADVLGTLIADLQSIGLVG